MKTLKNSLLKKPVTTLWVVGLAIVAAIIGGCSTDSPTAPNQGGQVPGSGQGGTGNWVISITATPSTIELANNSPISSIGVDIRQAGSGAAPPQGTLFQINVTNGTMNGQTEMFGSLANGRFSGTFTALAAGTAVITARLEQSVAQKVIQVIHPDDSGFSLTHMEPNVGDPEGGDIVAIFGINIREPVNVRFGANNAEILGVQSGRIRVRTPPASGTVPVGSTSNVSVAVTSGVGTQFQASDTLNGAFTYAHGGSGQFPQIFSLNPNSGSVAGGNTVVARGSGFSDTLRVMMQADNGPAIEAPVISSSSSVVNFIAPAASLLAPPSDWDGVADVWVQNLDTGLNSSKVEYHYGATIFVSSIVPGTGDPAGGEVAQIIGSGFEAPLQVFIGDAEQTVTTITPTQITILTSPAPTGVCSATALGVVVKSVITGVESNDDVQFTYQAGNPVVASVAPGSGSHGGGGGVTINGSNFGIGGGGVQLRFGTASASNPNLVSSSTITATLPASGSAPVSCDDNGDGVTGTRFEAESVSVSVVNLPQGCTGTLTGAFVYNSTPCNEPPLAECNNGIDDDGDTFTDFPADPECTSLLDNDESS